MVELKTSRRNSITTAALIGGAVAATVVLVMVATKGLRSPATKPTTAIASNTGDDGPLWSRACAKSPAGQEVCYVEQYVITQPQRDVLLRVQIGYMGANATPRLIILTPSGVWLPSGLSLTLDGSKPIALPFNTCEAAGCIAAVDLEQGMLDRFTAGNVLVVRYSKGDSTPVDLPVRMATLVDALKTVSAK